MSLEEELVFKIKKDRKEDEDVRRTCKELIEGKYFNLDLKKVEVSLRRYELLQQVNFNKKDRKKMIKERFNALCKESIEYVTEDPSVVGPVKIRKPFSMMAEYCNVCNGKKLFYSTKYTQLKEKNGIFTPVKIINYLAFNYCFNCGNFEIDPLRKINKIIS